MNRVRFLPKITNPANLLIMLIMVLAMAFTFGCSNDKDDGGGSKDKWCSVVGGGLTTCFEVGKKIKTDAACRFWVSLVADENGFFPEEECEGAGGTLGNSKPENCTTYHCTEE